MDKVENFEEVINDFIEEIEKIGERKVEIESERLCWDGDAPGWTYLVFEGNIDGGFLKFRTYTAELIDAELNVDDISTIEESTQHFILDL
jgi:hypothetical protein